MERKMNIADFAALVGTTPKTIYDKINNYSELPEIERLNTVFEKVKGRTIKLIVTDSEQVEYFKNLYGKNTVIESKYYETLTDDNSYKQVNNLNELPKLPNNADININILNQYVTYNKELNERYEQKINELIEVNNELGKVRGQQLLLEDKASREGLYLNEINDLKKENHRNKLLINLLITVIVCLLIVIISFITYNFGVNNHKSDIGDKVETQIEHTN